MRSTWVGLLAVAALLGLFVGAAPGSPDPVYTVNSTGGAVTGACLPSSCTLPDAIVAANGDGDASQIQFAISGGGSPQTIQLTQNLPAITEPVTIDGTTQLGPSATTPGITVLGGSGVTQGLDLAPGSDSSTVVGLALGGFSGTATEAALTVESGNNAVSGNYVGVQADGTTGADNQLGILVTGNDNTIGGDTATSRNVVVNSNSVIPNTNADGILVQGNGDNVPAADNQILGNYVGVLGDGTTVARNEGSDIQVIGADGTTIGGQDPADGNVLAGAGSPDAIFLGDFADTNGQKTTVQNNLIGLTADGSASLGPEAGNGIDVDDRGSNTIADNTIADMYQGIDICDSPDNTVVRNVIGSNLANGGLDLGSHDQGISMENGFCAENGSATGNVIGGTAANGNTVIDSTLNDVAIDADDNEVSFNALRGTRGGPVVEIAASDNQVMSNEINGAKVGSTDGDGVLVDSGNANSIEENSIHDNQNLGIELVSGANDDQPAPTLGSATVADGAITVQGTYDFPAGNPYTIDVYQSPSCESGGAGTTWVGSFTVSSNGPGSQPFTSPVLSAHSPDTVITATATAPDGSTSEFSNCATLGSAPNVFTVDTTGDGDDGACLPGFCSLRDAINAVNGYAGAGATLKFAITGGWPQTISLLTALPPITTPVSIDGTTEPGTPANTPGVTLDAAGAVGLGLDLASGSGGSTVRGLAFGGFSCECFPGDAIQVESNGNTIAGDWFGVAADSAPLLSSGTDIEVTGDNNTIGGMGTDANVLVNGGTGILVDPSGESSPGPAGTVIQGNLIGFHPDGTPADVGASTGIDLVDASGTVIGSDVGPGQLDEVSPALGNLIADAGSDAILIQRFTGHSSNSVVAGNFIGVDRAGNPTNPGGGNTNGIHIVDSSSDQIGPGNIVANSVQDGVLVDSSDLGASGDRIVANSIYANGGLGIDLQGEANDNIAAPVITSATGNGVSGTFTSSNSDPVFIEVFMNPSCGEAGAGQTYLVFGSASPGSWTVPVGLANGESVTVTATDQFTDDTSEFSNCATVGVTGSGALSGAVSTNGQNHADLTALGGEDWAVWGYANNGTSTSLAPDVRKSGGSEISNLTDIDPTEATLRGLGQFAGQGEEPFGFDWSDGSGPGAATGAAAGLEHDGQPNTTPTNGDGFSFTVPADTTQRTLTVFTSEHWGTGTLTATLSDGSAQPYTQSVVGSTGFPSFGGNQPGVFTIRYEAASAGQHLTVSWTESDAECPTFGCDDAAIYAVALSGPLSNLTVNATPSSAGAGIDQVPISTIPNAWLSFYAGTTSSSPVGSTPVGSTPVGSTPVGSTPVGSTPVGSTPVGSTPVGSTPVGSTPVGSTGLLGLPVGSTPVGSTALGSLLLSQIPLCGDAPVSGTSQAQCVSDGATWAHVLAGTPLAGLPLNALTLANVVGNSTAKSNLAALPLKDVSFATTLFQSVHWSSLLLGGTPLESLPPPAGFDSWCGGANPAIPADGGSCANVNGFTSVLQMDVGGQLGSAPVGSTPVGSTPVGSTPVGSTPVGSTDVPSSRLANLPLADIATYDGDLPSIVHCSPDGTFDCTGKTLGDAYAAQAIVSGATFTTIQHAMAHDGITYDDVLIAILGAAGLPWEQLPLQGLQPYSQTPSTVHYTISTNVDCSAVSQFTITARLPSGFFPVNNSASVSVGNNAPVNPGVPNVSQQANAYQWTADCPSGDNNTETATLTFDSWVGLRLGTFTTGATVAANSFSTSTTGAPVTVHQNPVAQDPSSATEIHPDTLVAGHIAFGGEQAFYKVKLDGLAPGTRISAFLNVPSDADLDLTMSAPAAASFFSSPVGSTPVGSTPIEDSAVGFAGAGEALSPDTLQDVPVGSTPVGSTPVGSTPVGSTSDNRGAGVNESGAIITTPGQTGYATIGISGYNGAASNQPFVLRVQETPPPALPTCPARTFANGSPSSFAAGTLPGSLAASTKTVFIVDKQRLTAMYGSTAVTNLLTGLNTLAARPEVSGTVLFVDGNAAVRSAYSAWDATPCDTSARNNVVKAINDVVAGYRANNALPNLHYVVLVGSDEATPMADTQDPVLLSPEENEASGLAFTTNGGTQGNALYASTAHNQILTDGAYGAFTNIQWLGRSLLLPQLSVSRLVESPSDILGQINRYLKGNGYTGTPQSGVGTLNPTSATVTGYDFLADGSQSVASNLAHQFSGLTAPATFSNGDPTIFNPPTTWKASQTYKAGATVQPTASTAITFQAQNGGTSGLREPVWPTILGNTINDNGIVWKAVAPWSAADVVSSVLASANPASIDALNGHYNQYELEAANGTLATTAQATSTNLAARILFTMGCHGGLNVADTLPGGNPASPSGQYLDWPELYAKDQAAVYIGNTGFGYGDTASVALSERLMALFARNLHSNTDSVGEQWAETLGQYFATAGAYDVYDEKVMEETTFYGLPFWHFGTAPVTPLSGALNSNALKALAPNPAAISSLASPASLSTSTDPITGTPSATVSFPATGDATQSQFGLYRPILPITSQEVTSSTGPATGVWIQSLQTSDQQNVTPTLGYPTIDLSAHEPAPAFQPIFFPASPFTLEHSYVFGNERDFLNVSDQFRPNSPADGKGTQRHVASGTFEVFYGNPSDHISPLISDVIVNYNAGTHVANIAVRATDPSNPVAEVAALVNDGTWHYVQLHQSSDPTLWTGTATGIVENPEVFAEATDGTNVSYSANKGSNFTSVPADQQPPAVITLTSPFGAYNLGSTVSASFSCALPAVQCTATLDGHTISSGANIDTSTPGQHTFVVTALDGGGNVISSLQRTYTVLTPSSSAGITFVNSVNSGGGMKPGCTAVNPFNSGTNNVNKFPNAICSSDGNAPAPSTFSWQVELANGTPQNGTPVVNTGAPITVRVTQVTTHGTNHGTPPVLLNGNNATLTIPTGSAMTSTALKVGNIGGGDWIQVTVAVGTSTLEMQVH